MSELGDKLRQIIGQETEPPLWIYVTKDQVPILQQAADALDELDKVRREAFVDGVVLVARVQEGRPRAVQALIDKYY